MPAAEAGREVCVARCEDAAQQCYIDTNKRTRTMLCVQSSGASAIAHC